MATNVDGTYKGEDGTKEWQLCPQCPFRKVPELPDPIHVKLLDKAKEAKRILDSRLADPPTIRQLARLCISNAFSIQEAFKAAFGVTIKAYCLRRKLEHAKFLLLASGDSLSAIAFATGFHDAPAFVKFFRARAGVTPAVFRSLGKKTLRLSAS